MCRKSFSTGYMLGELTMLSKPLNCRVVHAETNKQNANEYLDEGLYFQFYEIRYAL